MYLVSSCEKLDTYAETIVSIENAIATRPIVVVTSLSICPVLETALNIPDAVPVILSTRTVAIVAKTDIPDTISKHFIKAPITVSNTAVNLSNVPSISIIANMNDTAVTARNRKTKPPTRPVIEPDIALIALLKFVTSC